MIRIDRIEKLKNGSETARWAAAEIERLDMIVNSYQSQAIGEVYEKAPWWLNPKIQHPVIT